MRILINNKIKNDGIKKLPANERRNDLLFLFLIYSTF